MSALVETMMYTSNEANQRFVPWHGLGTSVEESPNSAEAIRLAGLDWEVNPLPIYNAEGKEIEGFKANTRSSDNSVLGIVTDRYKIVQNAEAFAFTDNLVGGDVRYETAGSLKEGKVIWLLAKLPETKILDDAFEQYICFTNAHDGTGAVRAFATDVRVVCNNTLNWALDKAVRSWSVRHTGDIASKIYAAQETLSLAHKYTDALKDDAERLVQMKITNEQFEKVINDIFPIDVDNDTERKIRNVENIKDNLFKCYNMDDLANYKGTVWGAMNAVADFVDHATPNRLTQKYQENNFLKIVNGTTVLDDFYKRLAA